MTLAEIKTMLESTGYPVAFHHFQEKQALPFLVFLTPYGRGIAADGQNAEPVNTVQVELYTAEKDPTAEKTLESVLDGNHIVPAKSQLWLSDEKVYETQYEFEMEE